jgi:RNA polymerase sigma factor (sigma-70 family)
MSHDDPTVAKPQGRQFDYFNPVPSLVVQAPSSFFSSPPAGEVELKALLASVKPKLKRLLASSGVPPEDAEDLLQDSLLTLVRRWSQMDNVESREAWLLGCLRLTILQYWRRLMRERRLQAVLSLEASASESPQQGRKDSARDVETLTASLPERDREILWLRFGLELNPREAAERLRCQPESVRKISSRALARARRQLAVAGGR